MSSRIFTISRYTVLEAFRTRLPFVAVFTIALVWASSYFVRELAITDSARFQTAFYAATVRFAIVFIAALYAISSVGRDFTDKGLDAVIALDLPRSHYVIGKLGGFLVVGVALALLAGVALVALAGLPAAAQWLLSFVLEIAIVVALGLFCAITFQSLMAAASFVLGFYILARVITAVRLIAGNPMMNPEAASHQVMRWSVEAVALFVPPFDRWTRTEWLVDSVRAWGALPGMSVHALLLLVILTAAAVFDLQRRNF